MDTYSSIHFPFSSASIYHERDTFVSEDGTIEGMHPYAFIAKVYTHRVDNPTYNDIFRGSSTEKLAWEGAMTKELKSLGDLGSFEMVNRPRSANIL